MTETIQKFHPVMRNYLKHGDSVLLPFLRECSAHERTVVIKQLTACAPQLFASYDDFWCMTV